MEESKKASPPDKFRELYNSTVNPHQLTEEEKSKAHFRYFIETANLLISNNQIKEGVIAHKYTMTLENQNIDLGLDSTLVHISNPDIRASLINEYNSYQWCKFHQNSLRVNIEEDSLLNYLKNKYKGYVQYICIWSTWTGNPFKNISEINKRFAREKLSYIYLCCNSDKTKWEHEIQEFKDHGEHIFLNEEQYMYLAKNFNIIGLPRYIIIDKSGRIVNDNASHPSPIPLLQNLLVKELTRYVDN